MRDVVGRFVFAACIGASAAGCGGSSSAPSDAGPASHGGDATVSLGPDGSAGDSGVTDAGATTVFDASAPITTRIGTVRLETASCAQATQYLGVDCTCNANEVAISGGCSSGSPPGMLNATQSGPTFGGAGNVWRITTEAPGGTRILPTQPFAVCLSGPGPSAVTVESSCAVAASDLAMDCTCATGEVAIAGGAFAGNQANMISDLQVGPSLGESAQVWRVATDTPDGSSIQPTQPFVVCLGAPYTGDIRVETTNCAISSDMASCTCKANEVAISGGAHSGSPGDLIGASQAGASFGALPQVWRVACVNPGGNPVACQNPFAVCLAM